ncbi:hypothetical protein OLF72_10435 [Streptococcus pneumoniae]|uniref:hypothetical protein n=1 Tax=Streptococcus pneumoniae TaxID=1313 RepID=UPI0005E02527|nr:hypothetical protein [Streptococcus pneumoniae]MBW5007104.1 hypothetical protein [Streptococcus pneumoniae]MDG7085447.1 hypothetical protein [Streptococcus pneumoniae]MDG7580631.1 hypothetical protein [Streptococcus pneumoniae]MDG8605796.1 hypothetical protein [Streptococcus pneumoniae]MDG8941715.1 hypothetical protein [Streptococcus pneumoniae]
MNKKFLKCGTLFLISCSILGSTIPAVTVFSDEVTITYNSENSSEKNELYNQLSAEKKGQFDELVSNLNLSEQEQLDLLQQYKEEHPRRAKRGIKSAIIKKVARFLAAKVGQKSVVEITDYLFEWQDNLEAGAENYLVQYGWDRNIAHWTIKTVSFIFL